MSFFFFLPYVFLCFPFISLFSLVFFLFNHHESIDVSAREKLARARTRESTNRQVQTPGFLLHGGPRTESWVQCLLDESFPSTSPRNHHHRFPRRNPPVPSSRFLHSSFAIFLSLLPNFDLRIISSRTDYFPKDDACAPKKI
jgi:hypothetical protein